MATLANIWKNLNLNLKLNLNLNRFGSDFLLILLFVMGPLRWVLGASQLTDLDHDDEIFHYIQVGALGNGRLNHFWGPLYGLWYKFLFFFESDLVRLYYLSGSLILVLLPVAYVLFLRKMRLSPLAYWSSTILLVLNPYFLYINRRPNHFALLVLFLFLFLSSFFKKKWAFYLVASSGFFFAALARPEYFLSFALSLITTLGFIIKSFRQMKKRDWSFLMMIFLMLFLLMKAFYLRPPEKDPGGNTHNKPLMVFLLKNFERLSYHDPSLKRFQPLEFAMELYHNPESLQEALKNNPQEFGRHIFENSKSHFSQVGHVLFSYHFLLKTPFFLFLMITILIHFILQIRFFLRKLRKTGKGQVSWPRGDFSILVFMAIIPFTLSGIFFGSLPQYIISQFPLVLSLGAGLLFPLRSTGD